MLHTLYRRQISSSPANMATPGLYRQNGNLATIQCLRLPSYRLYPSELFSPPVSDLILRLGSWTGWTQLQVFIISLGWSSCSSGKYGVGSKQG